eukprot:TRINITY_DN40104_c0_g2_i1.p1 TRINITY_DN40104_c0_g2~~TRINITY_DN40104_c0_g2_i1.p1  ORF type:complete len:105 (-),score=2.60 TRINITY_DN40104_c0_g2_i1:517-831(-)
MYWVWVLTVCAFRGYWHSTISHVSADTIDSAHISVLETFKKEKKKCQREREAHVMTLPPHLLFFPLPPHNAFHPARFFVFFVGITFFFLSFFNFILFEYGIWLK